MAGAQPQGVKKGTGSYGADARLDSSPVFCLIDVKGDAHGSTVNPDRHLRAVLRYVQDSRD